jgi:hypothetical protein
VLEDDVGQRPDAFDLFQGVIGGLGIALIYGQFEPFQAFAFPENVGGDTRACGLITMIWNQSRRESMATLKSLNLFPLIKVLEFHH